MGDRDVKIPISATGGDQAAAEVNKVTKAVDSLNRGVSAASGMTSSAGGGGGGRNLLPDSIAKSAQLFAGAAAVGGGLRLATGLFAAMRGDSAKLLESLERLPFGIGAAVQAGHELVNVLRDAAGHAAQVAMVTGLRGDNRAAMAFGVSGLGGLHGAAISARASALLTGAPANLRGALEASLQADAEKQGIQAQLDAVRKEAEAKKSEALLKGLQTPQMMAYGAKLNDEGSVLARINELDQKARAINAAQVELEQASDPKSPYYNPQRASQIKYSLANSDATRTMAELKDLRDLVKASQAIYNSTYGSSGSLADQATNDINTRLRVQLRQIAAGDLRGAGAGVEGRGLTGRTFAANDPVGQIAETAKQSLETQKQMVEYLREISKLTGVPIIGLNA